MSLTECPDILFKILTGIISQRTIYSNLPLVSVFVKITVKIQSNFIGLMINLISKAGCTYLFLCRNSLSTYNPFASQRPWLAGKYMHFDLTKEEASVLRLRALPDNEAMLNNSPAKYSQHPLCWINHIIKVSHYRSGQYLCINRFLDELKALDNIGYYSKKSLAYKFTC